MDLVSYAQAFGNGQSEKVNAEMYLPYVSQTIATYILNVKAQNFTAMGNNLGLLFQILVGSADLEVIAPQQYTMEELLTLRLNALSIFTNETNAAEVFQGFADALNKTDVNVTALAELTTGLQTLVMAANTLKSSLQTGDYDSDITAIETFITEVLEFVRNAKAGLEADYALEGQYYEAFFSAPLKTLGQALFNEALNLPEITKMSFEQQEDLLNGDFSDFGEISAQIAQIVYANL